MADLQSILDEVRRLHAVVETLPARINVSAAQVVVVNGLSDISENLGMIQAGEFRTGNRISPGDGFSGVRIGYPGFTYGGVLYNIAGIDADTLQFGLRSSDGAGVFGGGNVALLDTGLVFTGNSVNLIWQDATGSTTVEMYYFGPPGPLLEIDLWEPGAVFVVSAVMTDTTQFMWFTWGQDAAHAGRAQFDLTVEPEGSKYTIGGEVEIHGQGSDSGATFLKLLGSSDVPSTSDPNLIAGQVRVYYRSGNLVFQVYSTGDTDEDRYFYTRMSGTDASSDWTISTDPV